MAQQVGGIEPLRDSFFGFLRRKTDFFTGAQTEEAAREQVLKGFKKNKVKADEDAREKAAKEKKRKAEEEKRRARLAEEKAKQQKQEEARVVDITDESAAAPVAVPPAASDASADAGSSGGKPEGEFEDNGEGKGIVPINNGAVFDHYRWTQTLQDLAIHVPVPAGTKAKSLVIDIKKKNLVHLKNRFQLA